MPTPENFREEPDWGERAQAEADAYAETLPQRPSRRHCLPAPHHPNQARRRTARLRRTPPIPPCTGYTRGTVAIKGRAQKYDRLIAVVRDLADQIGVPYVIENVEGAKRELRTPALLCGRMFGLTATDTDGTPLVMDRHRLFETNWPLLPPEHLTHDRTLQVAGSYGGARRDKREAREVRRGGYVPTVEVQRELLGTPWMSEKGCQLSIPPAYTEFIGAQLLEHLERAA
jgi:DNA (cytosine-5)-methyltransferase 1